MPPQRNDHFIIISKTWLIFTIVLWYYVTEASALSPIALKIFVKLGRTIAKEIRANLLTAFPVVLQHGKASLLVMATHEQANKHKKCFLQFTNFSGSETIILEISERGDEATSGNIVSAEISASVRWGPMYCMKHSCW